jgi:type IV pilus assembly protein PilP
MALLGLGAAFTLSLRFIGPAFSQTGDTGGQKLEAPPTGDLPPEFLNEVGDSKPSPAPSPSAAASPTTSAKSPAPTAASSPADVPPQTAAPSVNPPATNPQPPAPAQPAATNAPPANAVGDGATAASPKSSSNDDYVYDPTGRRDPFKPYRVLIPSLEKGNKPTTDLDSLEPLQRWDVDRLQVVGILWDVNKPRAMLKDPDGFVYTVFKNTKVGRNNGYVASIREGEVIVIQTVEDEGTSSKETKVLQLGK